MPSPRLTPSRVRAAALSARDGAAEAFGRLRPWPTEAPDGPAAFIARGRSDGTQRVVVCVGDSITRGAASADYVALLRAGRAGPGTEFVNAGIDGNLAWNVRQRLDAVIACTPDAVTLLVGTNDVNATVSPHLAEHYRRNQGLPQAASLPWFRENVAGILDRLLAETRARVAVLQVPPLGEDLGSPVNARVREYNAALADVAAERGVAVLPLHERLAATIPANTRPPSYDGSEAAAVVAVLRHMVLRQGWDRVSRASGLHVLTDHIHLNDRAAAVLAGLVEEFLAQEGLPGAG